MEELEAVCFKEKEQNDTAIDLFDGPMAVITQGGNELMYSYNNVTQSLLRKVCTLHEKLQEKEKEIVMVKGENERLLQRIHELLIGAELREEARESITRSKHDYSRGGKVELEFRSETSMPGRSSERGSQSYFVSWFKITCLLGLTIGTTIYLKEAFEI